VIEKRNAAVDPYGAAGGCEFNGDLDVCFLCFTA
jgi:hypothetical protein